MNHWSIEILCDAVTVMVSTCLKIITGFKELQLIHVYTRYTMDNTLNYF